MQVLDSFELLGDYATRHESGKLGWNKLIGEFDPGSERTLTVCLIHASRAGSAMGQRRTGE